MTYVATSELENMSLTLPPATLRNAAPLYPPINRKTRYTAVERHHGYHSSTEGYNPWDQDRAQQKKTHTYVRCERNGEYAQEEQGKRDAINDIAPIDF
jgi:hypothetical protein